MTQDTKTAPRRELPERRTITLPDPSYQPTKAEQERKHDMPGASIETVRSAFFRPVTVQREGAD